MTSDVIAAYVSNNALAPNLVGDVINAVYVCLASLGHAMAEPKPLLPKPAVPIRRSITPDYLICLEDGKKLKMLKRHLRTSYQMTPEDYRARWDLPSDYPMVAPNYAEVRSAFAKKIGLGHSGTGRRRRRDTKKEGAAASR